MGRKKKLEVEPTSRDEVPKKTHSGLFSWFRNRFRRGRKKDKHHRGKLGNSLRCSVGDLCENDTQSGSTSTEVRGSRPPSLSTEQLNALNISNINANSDKPAAPNFLNDLNARLGIRPPSPGQEPLISDSSPPAATDTDAVLNHRLMVNKQKKRPPSRFCAAQTNDLFKTPTVSPLNQISEEIKDEQPHSSTEADEPLLHITGDSSLHTESSLVHHSTSIDSTSGASTAHNLSTPVFGTFAYNDNQLLGSMESPFIRSSSPSMTPVTDITFRSGEHSETDSGNSVSLKMATSSPNPKSVDRATKRQSTKSNMHLSSPPPVNQQSGKHSNPNSSERLSSLGSPLCASKSPHCPNTSEDVETTHANANTMKF